MIAPKIVIQLLSENGWEALSKRGKMSLSSIEYQQTMSKMYQSINRTRSTLLRNMEVHTKRNNYKFMKIVSLRNRRRKMNRRGRNWGLLL